MISALVRSFWGLFVFILMFPSVEVLTIILVSASSSCFTLAVSMYKVPRAWDPRSQQSMLDGPLYFEANRPRWPKRCY